MAENKSTQYNKYTKLLEYPEPNDIVGWLKVFDNPNFTLRADCHADTFDELMLLCNNIEKRDGEYRPVKIMMNKLIVSIPIKLFNSSRGEYTEMFFGLENGGHFKLGSLIVDKMINTSNDDEKHFIFYGAPKHMTVWDPICKDHWFINTNNFIHSEFFVGVDDPNARCLVGVNVGTNKPSFNNCQIAWIWRNPQFDITEMKKIYHKCNDPRRVSTFLHWRGCLLAGKLAYDKLNS